MAEIKTRSIFGEVLLKNEFMLNYQKEKEPCFSKNKLYRIKDGSKEYLICMDIEIHADKWKKEPPKHKDTFFICLECTTKHNRKMESKKHI